MDLLKVSAKSSPNGVAGAIAGLIKENGKVEMQAVGAGAINQAVKAVAIARGFMIPTGVDITCTPCFTEVMIEDSEKTGIRFSIESKSIN